ncbi:MAG TPA: LuxR C-terminal-related transcriptional regulator [Kineosporiaceae bacterium]|nr:LuxR C-terminal-related transcriptional regulator [Kineosporiaceae bacterium]
MSNTWCGNPTPPIQLDGPSQAGRQAHELSTTSRDPGRREGGGVAKAASGDAVPPSQPGRTAPGARSGTTQVSRRPGAARGIASDLLPRLATLRSVPRGALLRRLEGLADDVSLILIAAPAGYGKTTVARQWAETTSRPSAWLRIDQAHRDAALLVRDLAAAVSQLGPSSRVLGRLLTHPPTDDLDAAVERLVSGVRAVGEPVLLVLDDLHAARARGALDLVVRLAERWPRGSRIVATADRRPRLGVRTLRGQGRFVELAGEDLAFTPDEAAALFRDSGVILPDDAVDEVVRRTEGWPAGLQLAATVLRAQPDPARAVDAIRGDHEAFAAYYRDEVLAELSVETIRFLLRTSVLERMSGALCDATLGSAGSVAWLTEIRTLGLPVTQPEEHGEWYRYHGLFRDMLRAELRRREPGEEVLLLQRASRWHQERQLPEGAIEYAVAAGAADVAARLVVAHAQEIVSRGGIRSIRRWIDTLGDETLEGNGPLAVIATWAWALTGDAARARRALRVAQACPDTGPTPDGSSSLTSAVVRARAALAPDGLDAMLVDAQRAVGLEPPGSRSHTLAGLLLGVAQHLTGATTEAARTLERAARFGLPEEHPSASVALAERALLAAGEGDWTTAQACARESGELVAAADLWTYGPSVLSFAAAARVAVHLGDAELARRHTARAVRLYRDPSPVAFPWLAAQAAVELGRLLVSFGEIAAAEAKVAEARRHLAVMPTVGLLPTWVDALDQDVRRAGVRSTVRGATTLTKAELRVLSLLPTHLSLAQIGDELVISRHTVKSQVASIYRKLGATSRGDAVHRARRAGLLEAGPLPHTR